MTEQEWVALVIERLRPHITDGRLTLSQGTKLTYAEEIRGYRDDGATVHRQTKYETDLLVREEGDDGQWIPRVVMEAKINRVTTHDAITYSQKAATHKAVHPYLRYGIILGHRRHYPLPGRLVRHGAHFDFMQSWVDFEPSNEELSTLLALVLDEVKASRALEEMLYQSRSANRERYTILHRPLHLGTADGMLRKLDPNTDR
jgi:hypothetical protein